MGCEGENVMNSSNSMPRVLGWVVGALSLIILAQTLISLRVHKSFQFLLMNYWTVVNTVFDFAVGWINLPWFSVSEAEQHFIVILTVCQSALLNSSRRYGASYLYSAIAVIVFLLINIAVFGIIPDSFILTPIFVAILVLALPFHLERTGDIRLKGYSANLVGVMSIFFVIASVNYVFTAIEDAARTIASPPV
jgi:hypothetical protein